MAKYGSLSYKSAFDPHLDWLVQALRTESAEWPVWPPILTGDTGTQK